MRRRKVNNMKRKSIGICICTLMMTSILAGSVVATDNWLMYGHDATHTGVSTSTTSDDFKLLFTKEFSGQIMENSGITIANDKIYFTTFSNKMLHCFDTDPLNSDPVYTHTFSEFLQSAPAININDNRIYFGSYNTNLYCYSTDSDIMHWSYNADGDIVHSPTLVDDKIYFGTIDGTMYCIRDDDTQSTKIWEYSAGGAIRTSPAVVDEKIYFGSDDGSMYCLGSFGNYLWDTPLGEKVRCPPSVVNGKVLVMSRSENKDTIHCLDALDGSIDWSFQTVNINTAIFAYPGLAIYNNRAYAPTADGLYSININNVNDRFLFETMFKIRYSPAIADGKVYVSDSSGLYCINANNGNEIYKEPTIKNCPIAIYDGLVLAAPPKKLYAIVGNLPPNEPEITGPTSGIVNETLSFDIVATDPNGDDLRYLIIWGDGTTSNYMGPFPSGEVVTNRQHRYLLPGQYEITVVAKEPPNGESSFTIMKIEITDFEPGFRVERAFGGSSLSFHVRNALNVSKMCEWNVYFSGSPPMLFWLFGSRTASGTVYVESGKSVSVTVPRIFALGKFNARITVTCSGTPSDTKNVEGIALIIIVLV